MKYKELTREQLEKIFKIIQKCFYSHVEWDLNYALVDMAFVTRYPSMMKLLLDVMEKNVAERPANEVSVYSMIHEVSKVLCTIDYWVVMETKQPDDRKDPEINDYPWVREKRKPTVEELFDLIQSEVIFYGSACTNYDYLKMCLTHWENYCKIREQLLKVQLPV